MLKTTNHKGFTIIEVVITIAIGAAVMALVLNAVQGARRSQRNTNRAADISALAGAINQYNSNRNALPISTANISTYLNELAHYDQANSLNWESGWTSRGTALNLTAATDAPSIVAKDANADEVAIMPAIKCKKSDTAAGDNADDLIETGGIRQIVILSRVEGDPNVFCEEV